MWRLSNATWRQSFTSAPEREKRKPTARRLLVRKRADSHTVASMHWYPSCIILKRQFKSPQGLIKGLPKVRERGAWILRRVCQYSWFFGTTRPSFWHYYVESCLQHIKESEFSPAWSVSTFTPTVLQEFPVCFFPPLIGEPLEQSTAFWKVQRVLEFR